MKHSNSDCRRRRRYILGNALAVLLIINGIVEIGAQEDADHGELYPEYRAMRAELHPFGEGGETPLIAAYYETCSRGTGASMESGTFESLGMHMAAHLWRVAAGAASETVAPDQRETVIVIHGYLAHPVQMAPIIRALLDAGYDVAAPELPGHALSDGKRGYIADFADYGQFLADFLEQVGPRLEGPLHVLGFSTGASTVLEYLYNWGDPFEAIVFASPLVKSWGYTWSRVGRAVAGIFTDSISTGYHDPLGSERLPFAWFDAQVAWNRYNRSYPPLERPLMLVQGSQDRVVNSRYNRRYLEERFSPVEYHAVPGASHVLYRTGNEAGRTAIEETVRYIESYR